MKAASFTQWVWQGYCNCCANNWPRGRKKFLSEKQAVGDPNKTEKRCAFDFCKYKIASNEKKFLKKKLTVSVGN